MQLVKQRIYVVGERRNELVILNMLTTPSSCSSVCSMVPSTWLETRELHLRSCELRLPEAKSFYIFTYRGIYFDTLEEVQANALSFRFGLKSENVPMAVVSDPSALRTWHRKPSISYDLLVALRITRIGYQNHISVFTTSYAKRVRQRNF